MKRSTKKTIRVILLCISMISLLVGVCVLDRHLHPDVYQTITIK